MLLPTTLTASDIDNGSGMSLRAHNFSAGPAVMPEPVLARIAAELCDWRGTGVSVMETSHRSAAFIECAREAEARLRRLLAIPDDYSVLFLQGGASLQFSATVMNLAGEGSVAIADTGSWSTKAFEAASRLAPVHRVCTLEQDARGIWTIPPVDNWNIASDSAYLHLCDNETIGGVMIDDQLLDEVDALYPTLPLVVDMSSSILSRPIDVSRYSVIYAGAQKNIGPAGLTLVIASPDAMAHSRAATETTIELLDDLAGKASRAQPRVLPKVLSWAAMADAESMFNTPPTFAWYAAGLVFEWLEEQGGLAAIHSRNQDQAARLYAAIDASEVFHNDIAARFRSLMNVPFHLYDEQQLEPFLLQAQALSLVGLKGHKSVGGCRASLYNALPDQAVDALLAHLHDFERRDSTMRASL